MIVLDASVLIELLLRTPVALAIEARLWQPGVTLHAPHLIDIEVTQAIRRYALSGQIEPASGHEAAMLLADFPITRTAHGLLLPRIWDLRHNLTAYDAAYVALAEALDAPLLTRDRRLAGAAGHHARIESI